jgi:hypothetical protein
MVFRMLIRPDYSLLVYKSFGILSLKSNKIFVVMIWDNVRKTFGKVRDKHINRCGLYGLSTMDSAKIVNGTEKLYFEQAYHKLKEFYGIELEYRYIVIHERSEFEKYLGRKDIEPWICAFIKEDKIIIYSPDAFESFTNHTKDEFPEVVMHEMNHLFLHKILGNRCPFWLSEGLSQYIAGQQNNTMLDRMMVNKYFLLTNEPHKYFSTKFIYPFSLSITKAIFAYYGKEKAAKFIFALKDHSLEDSFKMCLEEIDTFLGRWKLEK